MAAEWGGSVEYDAEVSKLSIVGAGMRGTPGVAEKMFAALASENINLKMITTADIKISVLIERRHGMRALRAVHQAFGLALPRPGAGIPTAGMNLPTAATGRDMQELQRRLSDMEGILVSDISLDLTQGRITLSGLPDKPGPCSNVFQVVAANGIIVDMIVQNHTAGRPQLSFSVPIADLERAAKLVRQSATTITPPIEVAIDAEIATINVLGVGMRSHTGVARRMFGALARLGINIAMINTSEVRLSVVVERARGEEACACLREVFLNPPTE